MADKSQKSKKEVKKPSSKKAKVVAPKHENAYSMETGTALMRERGHFGSAE